MGSPGNVPGVQPAAFHVDGNGLLGGGKADNVGQDAHIHVELGEPVQLMEPVPREQQMALEFPNISAWVPDLFGPGAAEQGNPISRTLQMLHLSRATQPKAPKQKERQVIDDC